MKIKMLEYRVEHWVGGELAGKGVARHPGETFTIGEDDLEKVQQSSADVWIERGWAKKVNKGADPVTAIEGENDGD